MTQIVFLGIRPENEHGHWFEVDVETWFHLRRILLVAGFSDDEGTGTDLLCPKNGTRCDAELAENLGDQLEFLVDNLDSGGWVAATAVSWWKDGEFQDSVDLFENPDLGVSVETITALREFLRASHGFVIRWWPESSVVN